MNDTPGPYTIKSMGYDEHFGLKNPFVKAPRYTWENIGHLVARLCGEIYLHGSLQLPISQEEATGLLLLQKEGRKLPKMRA